MDMIKIILFIMIINTILHGCVIKKNKIDNIHIKDEIEMGCYGVCIMRHKVKYDKSKKIDVNINNKTDK